ncbi:hypothetical protein EG328_007772 [Venturia inaequalis]|uniref:Uncharacterized protein n=1 Tax=Venturia inaequalis TaxID=5025 RepID=A0A8H3UCQ9_VENIN|nr:hypothetical protein EG328_007772 [Venturia inaequalis]
MDDEEVKKSLASLQRAISRSSDQLVSMEAERHSMLLRTRHRLYGLSMKTLQAFITLMTCSHDRKVLSAQCDLVRDALEAVTTGFNQAMDSYQDLALRLRELHDEAIAPQLLELPKLKALLDGQLLIVEGQVPIAADEVQQVWTRLEKLVIEKQASFDKSRQRHQAAEHAYKTGGISSVVGTAAAVSALWFPPALLIAAPAIAVTYSAFLASGVCKWIGNSAEQETARLRDEIKLKADAFQRLHARSNEIKSNRRQLERGIQELEHLGRSAQELFTSSSECHSVLATDKARSAMHILATSEMAAFRDSFDNVCTSDDINAEICAVGWKFWHAATEVCQSSTLPLSDREHSQKMLDHLQQRLRHLSPVRLHNRTVHICIFFLVLFLAWLARRI